MPAMEIPWAIKVQKLVGKMSTGRPIAGVKQSKEAQLEALVAALQRTLERTEQQAHSGISAAKHAQVGNHCITLRACCCSVGQSFSTDL